jgi:hypothetical protein
MSRRVVIMLMAALSSSGGAAFAQTTQFDAPLAAQAKPDDAGDRTRQGDDALRTGDDAYEEHAHSPPGDSPAREVDATVGLGSSVDRAPRDVREPFDE